MKILLVSTALLCAFDTMAQSFSIDWSKGSAGAAIIGNASFSIDGTVGQADASPTIGAGGFSLRGGFWAFLADKSQGQTVFNPSSDFSATYNSDTSTWSYRYKAGLARDGNYPLLPGFGSAPHEVPWTASNPDPGAWTLNGDAPTVAVNRTGGDLICAVDPPFPWPSGAMLLHPGNGQLVVVSWLSQTTAIANITFRFSDLDPNGGNGIAWFVERNNSSHTLASGVFSDGGASSSITVSNVAVFDGDRINFIVDANGNYFWDSTRLDAVISASPVQSLDLRIRALARAGNDLFVTYNSFAGQNFALQTRTNLQAGAWTTIPGKTNVGTGGLVQVVLSNALVSPQQYYRVQLLP